MIWKNSLKKLLAALSILLLVTVCYVYVARPYQLHLGATDEELHRAMPGDELDPRPIFFATRAITINAPAEKIWPWLVQMSFDRAGFYGYDIIEGIGSKSGMRSAERIMPEFQHIAVGDKVPISLVAGMKMYAIEQGKYLIWAGSADDAAKGAFIWALYPLDSNHTRLISRIRWTYNWSKPALLPLDLFTEFTDHIAVRKILTGIKVRAEGGMVNSIVVQSIPFFIYLSVLLTFFVTIFRLFIKPLSKKTYLSCLTAGIIWLIVWYSPMTVWFEKLF